MRDGTFNVEGIAIAEDLPSDEEVVSTVAFERVFTQRGVKLDPMRCPTCLILAEFSEETAIGAYGNVAFAYVVIKKSFFSNLKISYVRMSDGVRVAASAVKKEVVAYLDADVAIIRLTAHVRYTDINEPARYFEISCDDNSVSADPILLLHLESAPQYVQNTISEVTKCPVVLAFRKKPKMQGPFGTNCVAIYPVDKFGAQRLESDYEFCDDDDFTISYCVNTVDMFGAIRSLRFIA